MWKNIIKPVVVVGIATTVASSTLDVSKTAAAESTYTIYDDLTWAVVSPNLTHADNQIAYYDYMRKCRLAAAKPNFDKYTNEERAQRLCDDGEENRLYMNQYQPRSVRSSETWLHVCTAPRTTNNKKVPLDVFCFVVMLIRSFLLILFS
jgi:hypothetical protein